MRGKSVILFKLLHSVGIVIISQESHGRFVCVKCARKVVNCYKLFAELQQVFISKSSNSSEESSEEIQITFTTHERSPTGITPSGKRRKGRHDNSPRSATAEHLVTKPRPLSKRSLFSYEDELSSVNEAINNLMNVDVDVCAISSWKYS